jgi:hypothetical protein
MLIKVLSWFCRHCICWLLRVTSCRMVQSTHTSWFCVLVEGSGDIRMSINYTLACIWCQVQNLLIIWLSSTLRELPLWILDNHHVNKCNMNDRRMKISTIKTRFCLIYYSLILAYSKRGFWSWCLTPLSIVFKFTCSIMSIFPNNFERNNVMFW